jgi:predicted LPLAT superfamily acyltransferase
MEKWDGKTKGSLRGYKFFIFCINFLGLKVAYFFCFFVSYYYIIFAAKQRDALIQFYCLGLGKTKKEAKKLAIKNFYNFGQTLIDRIAMFTPRKKQFTHTFNNEKALRELNEENKGGILLSAHLGNWEIAGNLIHDRISSTINIVMLDAEVEKVKSFIELKTGGPSYNLIPIKDDLSHLILIHRALKRNEFVAIHADRITGDGKSIELNFLQSKAKFPLGPFILAEKFKVPVTFVFAVKGTKTHYELFASEPIRSQKSAESIAKAYVKQLETMIEKYPTQWFNFYKYYAD